MCVRVFFQMSQDPYSYLCHCLSPVAVPQDRRQRSQSSRSKFIRTHGPTSVYMLVGTKSQQSSPSPASSELRPCYIFWDFVLNLQSGFSFFFFAHRPLFTWMCKVISCQCVLSLSPHWFPETVLIDSPSRHLAAKSCKWSSEKRLRALCSPTQRTSSVRAVLTDECPAEWACWDTPKS